MRSTTARCVMAVRIAMMFNVLCLLEGAPYKFGFRTATQHRQEEKQPDGTILGEYGYVTANGFYLTTVYATDAKGRFLVLERRKEKVGEPAIKRQPKALNLDAPKTEGYFFNYTSTNEVQKARSQLHHHEVFE
ncbi:hypothetical protein TCAL_15921 [Tigriopus californicus]|uniref:Uncharacterized protein n=1 Tax=Tigriopus californicus TaxID=6832 RepID=A0A553PFA7_TIGCA|nr:hypothetical protein TCAL_15921 [Tigriopus californicus]